MKTQVKINAFFVLASLPLIAGCTAPQQPQPVQQGNLVHMPGVTRGQAMEAAENVLSEMHFPLVKNDQNLGIMRTQPLSGAQFFEFWRADNATLDSAMEANIHTIRRSAELEFRQTDDQVSLACTVRVQRLSLPEKDIPSISQAYRLYSQSSRDTQRLKLHPELTRAMVWIDLGNDAALAEEILKRIAQRVARSKKDESI